MTKFQQERDRRRDKNCADHSPIASAHEGLALVWEEFSELKRGIFRDRTHKRDPRKLLSDLAQLAAMCERMADDLKLEERVL